MNKERRKRIDEVRLKLAELKEELEELRYDEQAAYDNLPEGLQEGERGEAMSEAIDNLDIAIDSVDEVDEYLDAALGG